MKKYIVIISSLFLLIIGIIYYLNQVVILRVVFEDKKNENLIQKYAVNQKIIYCYRGNEKWAHDDCVIKTKRINVWKIDKDKSVNNTSFIKKLGVVEDL
jgi:hypothetical protein